MDIGSKDYWIEQWNAFDSENRQGDGFKNAGFWDEKAPDYHKEKGDSAERNRCLINHLKENEIIRPGATVLDIGSGPGTFAIPFAEYGAKVTCVDVSQGMLDQISQRAPQELLSALHLVQGDWRVPEIEAKIAKQYDLVFAHMTPAINCADDLLRMMKRSRGWCYLAGWAGDRENQPMDDLFVELLGENRKSRHFQYALNLLYSMGIYPEIRFDTQAWSKSQPFGETVEYYTRFFSRIVNMPYDVLKQKIETYLNDKQQNGQITQVHKGTVGGMLWSVNQDPII